MGCCHHLLQKTSILTSIVKHDPVPHGYPQMRKTQVILSRGPD
jgi:hypothetical protein